MLWHRTYHLFPGRCPRAAGVLPERGPGQGEGPHRHVVGGARDKDSLGSLDGSLVSGRKVVVLRNSDRASLESCHVLFVGRSRNEDLTTVVSGVQRRPVLTIADFQGFAQAGGTIGLTRQDDRVGFEINREAAEEAGLEINARRLYLGKLVQGGQGEMR